MKYSHGNELRSDSVLFEEFLTSIKEEVKINKIEEMIAATNTIV